MYELSAPLSRREADELARQHTLRLSKRDGAFYASFDTAAARAKAQDHLRQIRMERYRAANR